MAEQLGRFHEAEQRLWQSVGVVPQERRVRLRTGETVRVQETGQGPAVLFIHGASNAGTSWMSLMAALGEFRCVALDRPGCGLSDPIVGGPLRSIDAIEAYDIRSSPQVITPLRGLNERMLLTDELLARVTMPALFLWGDEDPNGGEAVARAFAPRLPHAQLEMVPEAGLAPWIDELDLCAARLRAFLTA